jgi:hypothetical protein
VARDAQVYAVRKSGHTFIFKAKTSTFALTCDCASPTTNRIDATEIAETGFLETIEENFWLLHFGRSVEGAREHYASVYRKNNAHCHGSAPRCQSGVFDAH